MQEEKEKPMSLYMKIGVALWLTVILLFLFQQYVESKTLAYVGGIITLAYIGFGVIVMIVNVATGRWSKKFLYGLGAAAVAGSVLGATIGATQASTHLLMALAGIVILGFGLGTLVIYYYRSLESDEFRQSLFSWPALIMPIVYVLIIGTAIAIPIRKAALMPFSLAVYYVAAVALAAVVSAAAVSIIRISAEQRATTATTEPVSDPPDARRSN